MVNTYAGAPGSPNRDFSYEFDIEPPSSVVLTRIGTPLEKYGTYTTSEIERLQHEGSPWIRHILAEVVWL